MKYIILCVLLSLTVGCEVYLYEEDPVHHHEIEHCDEPEPYYYAAEEYWAYYDYDGYYEGECGEWYVGQGWYEEWCNWTDECGWRYVQDYRY